MAFNSDGSFTYTPGLNFTGTDAFTYDRVDTTDLRTSNIAAVTIDVGTTPLPATLPLLATALGGLGLLGWRRKRKTVA